MQQLDSQAGTQPLSGLSILVTRPKHQAKSFCDKLSALGASPLCLPAIKLQARTGSLDFVDAVKSLHTFDWIIFTSVNGVQAVLQQLSELRLPVDALFQPRLAAIGPATEKSLRAAGANAVLVPDEYISDSIVPQLGNLNGKKVLLPRADIARTDIIGALKSLGAEITQVNAYSVQSNLDPELIEYLTRFPTDFVPDYISFTSPSTVSGTREILEAAGLLSWLDRSQLIAIGPITARRIHELGYETSLIAEEFTTDGLLSILVQSRSNDEQ